jgi:uncharacterized membrane protein YphA (DoxX/SURF4 family)
MFPQGGPGVALLLLRVSVVAFLIIAVANYNGSANLLVLVGAVVISISLLIGFLTPFFCVIVVALVIGNMIINPHASSVLCVIAIANAAALGLLGPGAYSLDSKLFGRRVTIVRPRKSVKHSEPPLTP